MGVYLPVSASLATGKVLIANLIRLFQATGNVRFGSAAAAQHDVTPTAASECEAAIHVLDFERPISIS